MSEIQVGQINSTDGSTAITTGADGYVSFAKTQIGGRRNLIINGAMQVAQRGTVTGITSSSYGGPDRHQLAIGGAGTWTMSQSSTAPTGFASSLKLDCTASAGSPTIISLFHRLEAQNLQHIKKGTADAESLTLSFWIRSNKTGNIQVNFSDSHNDRMISSVITISSANTFEYKTITIAGDTTGALNNDNTTGILIEWFLDGSSTYTSGATPSAWEAKSNADRGVGTTIALADSTANELYITGVQLEVGTVATPFEHRSYGEELALCQRYFEKSFNTGVTPVADAANYPDRITCIQYASSTVGSQIPFRTTKRTSPSITLYCGGNIGTPSNATGSIAVYSGGWAERTGSSNRQSEAEYSIDVAHSGTVGQALIAEFGWVADAEL